MNLLSLSHHPNHSESHSMGSHAVLPTPKTSVSHVWAVMLSGPLKNISVPMHLAKARVYESHGQPFE